MERKNWSNNNKDWRNIMSTNNKNGEWEEQWKLQQQE